jgi:transcriptional regulator with XRE-family HTH domain
MTMTKTKTPAAPNWLNNLRLLMDKHDLNPRSLSLKAGLNATAVRDMLDGRSRFPRYDTIKAMAEVLETTPALLMGDADAAQEVSAKGQGFGQDLELLTEIITRLQEVTEELDHKLSPRDFAAMSATIYKRIQATPGLKKVADAIKPQIIDLLDFESLRTKRAKR